MTQSGYATPSIPPALRVAAGEDRLGEHRGHGITWATFGHSVKTMKGDHDS